jgi:hypothetical protein
MLFRLNPRRAITVTILAFSIVTLLSLVQKVLYQNARLLFQLSLQRELRYTRFYGDPVHRLQLVLATTVRCGGRGASLRLARWLFQHRRVSSGATFRPSRCQIRDANARQCLAIRVARKLKAIDAPLD